MLRFSSAIVVLICLATPPAARATASQASDAEVLLRWKAGFTMSGAISDALDKDKSAWKGNRPCSDEWLGIGCAPVGGVERVIAITINVRPSGSESRGFLSTPLPAYLGELPLNGLMLLNVKITGRTPWVALQKAWTGMTVLALQQTGLRKLPSKLPPKLVMADFRFNNLQGAIPRSYKSNLKLQELKLSSNKLSKLPRTLPPSLVHLDIARNQFAGTLAPALERLSKLKFLYAGENKFTGALPATWPASLKTLTVLSLGGNTLSSSLPNLGAWASMEGLFLENNQFGGPVQSDLSALRRLQTLSLSNNQLSGPLPSRLPPAAFNVSMEKNAFTGGLPETWAPNPNIRTLSVYDNPAVGGSIPSTWALDRAFSRSVKLALVPGTSVCGAIPPSLSQNIFGGKALAFPLPELPSCSALKSGLPPTAQSGIASPSRGEEAAQMAEKFSRDLLKELLGEAASAMLQV